MVITWPHTHTHTKHILIHHYRLIKLNWYYHFYWWHGTDSSITFCLIFLFHYNIKMTSIVFCLSIWLHFSDVKLTQVFYSAQSSWSILTSSKWLKCWTLSDQLARFQLHTTNWSVCSLRLSSSIPVMQI